MDVAYRTAPRRRRVIPYDAATVMRLEEDSLLAMVTRGLSKAASGKPYLLRDHPRLEIICRAKEPGRAVDGNRSFAGDPVGTAAIDAGSDADRVVAVDATDPAGASAVEARIFDPAAAVARRRAIARRADHRGAAARANVAADAQYTGGTHRTLAANGGAIEFQWVGAALANSKMHRLAEKVDSDAAVSVHRRAGMRRRQKGMW